MKNVNFTFSSICQQIPKMAQSMASNHSLQWAVATLAAGALGYAIFAAHQGAFRHTVQFRTVIKSTREYSIHEPPSLILGSNENRAQRLENHNDAIDEKLQTWITQQVRSILQQEFVHHFDTEKQMDKMVAAVAHAFMQGHNKKIPLTKRGIQLLARINKNNIQKVWIDRETFHSMYCTRKVFPMRLTKACHQDCPDNLANVKALFVKLVNNNWADDEQFLLTLRNWTNKDLGMIQQIVYSLCFSLSRNKEYKQIIDKYKSC